MPEIPSDLSTALADRYKIERHLGEGGMATVYLAQDLKHDRKVALKVLKPELAAALGGERFVQEIKTTANLQHPHILPLFDSGTAGEEGRGMPRPFLFYVMPYIEGETLRERMNREGQLPLDDALRITREVAAALSYAHSNDVIHRDIKPENVLLSSDEAVVADFGIAKAITRAGGEHLTATGFSIGTPAYMSPEQASGEQQIDGRSDLYALGCVLYEMLAGEPPFTGPTAQALIAKKLSEPTPRISVVRDTVPDAVEHAITTVLSKAPADRFATAKQFAKAVSGEAAQTAPVPQSGKRRFSRRSVLLGAAAAALVVVTVGLGKWFGGGDAAGAVGRRELPLVVMMDSPHPRRVYDEETRTASGTNADVISDILLDLPIIRQREAIGPDWHRDEEILRFDPDLVIIHYSGFRQEDSSGPRERLKVFITFFADTDTQFLIYSRAPEDTLRTRVEDLLRDVDAEHPGLLDRIRVFGVVDYGPPQWLNTMTSTQLKLAVKKVLGLQ